MLGWRPQDEWLMLLFSASPTDCQWKSRRTLVSLITPEPQWTFKGDTNPYSYYIWIVHGKWLSLKLFWSLAQTVSLQGHLTFHKLGYVEIYWPYYLGDCLGLEPRRMAVESTPSWSSAWWMSSWKSQKEPQSFIDPCRLSRTRGFALLVMFLAVINVWQK